MIFKRLFLAASLSILCKGALQSAYEPFEIKAIKVTNTAVVNINTAAQTEFNNINTTAVINTDTDIFTSVTSNGVVCEPGTYMVDIILYQTGGSGRNTVAVEVTVNSTSTGARSSDSYKRRGSGHDESSSTVSDLVTFTTASKIGFDTLRLSAGGNVAAPVGQSMMRIVRVDD